MTVSIIYTLKPEELVQILILLGKARRKVEAVLKKENLDEISQKQLQETFTDIDRVISLVSPNNDTSADQHTTVTIKTYLNT